MNIFSFGVLDKKLYIIIIISIISTINFVVCYKQKQNVNGILYKIEEEFGPLIVGIITYFIFKPKNEKNKQRKKSIKDLIILFTIKGLRAAYDTLFDFFLYDNCYKYTSILNTVNGIEIFLVTLGTFILLKYKYYIHHLLSMIIFLILGIGNDILLDDFAGLEYDYLYIYIFYIINEVIMYCYMKYMMDKLFYHYTEVLILYGLFGTIFIIIFYGIILLYEYKNDQSLIIDYMKRYFDNISVVTLIFMQFLFFILNRGIYELLLILILYYLRPNHIIIADEIYIYLNIVFFEDKPNRYYSIIIFVFQMIFLLFYFEILELNFLGLNKNTVKNIQSREILEFEGRKSNVSEIELFEQYIVNNERNSGGSDDENKETPGTNKSELLIGKESQITKNQTLEEFTINDI